MPTSTILTRGVIYLASLRHMHSYIRIIMCQDLCFIRRKDKKYKKQIYLTRKV